jgi:fructosamine-3-kinase
MEWIQQGKSGPRFDEDFAFKLAAMHRQTDGVFGLDHDNYIGTLPQKNSARNSWAEFYVELRLEPQIRMARDSRLIDAIVVKSFDRVNANMQNLFPTEPPALLHGDLWSGNYMCTDAGEATIFDPAVYYGHREMDLAMSKLFGGFHQSFYHFYHEYFPLENGWEERIFLAQLYPLLVHVNLFGSGYVAQLKSCLGKFV